MLLNSFGHVLTQQVAWAAFAFLLAAACVTDLRARRIPNVLVLFMAVGGVALSVLLGPWPSAGMRSLGGLATGFAIWIPLYMLRMIGAGDVKFFAAASSWLGPAESLEAAFVSAVMGGLLSLAWILRSGALTALLSRRRAARHPGNTVQHPDGTPPLAAAKDAFRVPYGIAMAAGLAVTAFVPGRTFA